MTAGGAFLLSRGLERAYRGIPGLAPISRVPGLRGPVSYAESWTLVLGSAGESGRFLLDIIICNPTDISYEVETTAAYLSLSFWGGSGGWQLLDRYSLRHFHASPARGEIVVGVRENPRCLLRLSREEGGFRLSTWGCLERSSFLRRGFKGTSQDISWDLRVLFREGRYPDAILEILPRRSACTRPRGMSFLCLPREVSGMIKANEVVYQPGDGDALPFAWFLQRRGSTLCSGGRDMFCLSEGSADLAALLRTDLPSGEDPRGRKGNRVSDPFLYLKQGHRAVILRNNPLERQRLRLLSWETGFGVREATAHHFRAEMASRFRGRVFSVRAVSSERLDILLPDMHGRCILRSWYPKGRIEVLHRGIARRLDAEIIVESACGGWWDCAADYLEIPVDLENP